ncbi:MAG: hypothetical protein ACO3GP_08080 [Candidatus Limnocylindrus sp.]
MNTTDRQPTQVRETVPERQNKTARDIQRDIDWMRMAYQARLEEQDKSIAVIGWSLMAIAALIAITALSILIW